MPRSFQHTATGVDLLEVPLPRSGNVSSAATRAPATASELVLAYFSRCADTIGLPRSLAQLYATLFLSEEPLAFDEIVALSGLSKASASTGLRDLERLHGVQRVMVANDRRSYYQAQLSLRRLLSAFVAESVAPGLMDGARLLDDAMALAEGCAHSDHFKARLQSLVAWHDRASEILPMLAVLASPSSDD
jgi:DNA-binding transcriptional regulator GbsR (MarR family)